MGAAGEGAFRRARRATARRYARPVTRRFVAGKLSRDPVYSQLLAHLPLPGPLLDLGCGLGQTLLLLQQLQPESTALGLDWDLRKLSHARRARGAGPGPHFLAADLLVPPPAAQPGGWGTVLLLDVLHYHPPDQQQALLETAVRLLAPGGRLLIRDADLDTGWRSTTTRTVERLARWSRWHRGRTLHYRPARVWMQPLLAAGLAVEVRPSWRGTPFGNVLVSAVR